MCGLEINDLTEAQKKKKRYIHNYCRPIISRKYYNDNKDKIKTYSKKYELLPETKLRRKLYRKLYLSTERAKEGKKQSDIKYRKSHPEVARKSMKKRRGLETYRVKEQKRDKIRNKLKRKRDAATLTNYYIKRVLKGIKIDNPPQELIDLKREQLKLKRKIYERQRNTTNI